MTTVPPGDEPTAGAPASIEDIPGLEPLTPTRVGPYVLLERLGEGGMGVVHRAHDPRLDREVAIKLLRAEVLGERAGRRARARLAREARAMAHVTHPHVVQVFDVGTVGEQVFIAMELVEGTTLTQWLRRRPRSTAEILDVFVQAGRGLAAAHQKGLIHRDFKPDNVLVGEDGRVLVTDFGLARAMEDGAGSRSRAGSDGSPEPAWSEPMTSTRDGNDRPVTRDDGLAPLTRTGLVMGTPAYMALEQHLGAATDARSDQFAFCVALFEALAGQRPFAGATDMELAAAKKTMRMRELPVRPGLRPAVRRAIVRGLDADPQQRWPDMGSLLSQLVRARSTQRWAWLGLGAVGVVAALVWFGRTDPRAGRCDATARLTEVWGSERQSSVSQALTATEVRYAQDTWQRVRDRIDEHLEQWSEVYREACTTAARTSAPEAALDSRMRCLDRGLARVEGLVATLEDADPDLVRRAVELASSLAPPQACLEPTAASPEPSPLPPTARIAQGWVRLEHEIQRVDILVDARRGQQALALAERLHEEATALGWPPARVLALLALGSALDAVNEFERAEQVLTEGVLLSDAHGLDRLAARAAAQLVWVLGAERTDLTEAERWARHALSRAERLGGVPLVEAEVKTALGGTYLSLGRATEAVEVYRRALTLYRRIYGSNHPNVATALSNLGAALASRGEYEDALEYHSRALEVWTQTVGQEHPTMADVIENTALVYSRLGRVEEAIDAQQRALALRRRTSDPGDLAIATSLNNLGAFEEERSNFARAEAHHREALETYETTLGPDALRTVASRINLGLAILRQGRHAEARAVGDRAISVLERTAADHPYLEYARLLQASAAERGGDATLAATVAEGVLSRCERGLVPEPSVCAEARFVLSRALFARPEQRPRAIELAHAAADGLPAGSAMRSELDAWLRTIDP